MSSGVRESVFVEEISAKEADGCELFSDVAEDVLLRRFQRKPQMAVSCPVMLQSMFLLR